MGRRFAEIAFTPLVKEQQKRRGSRQVYERVEKSAEPGDTLGVMERAFIRERDGFYMASVSETGWPYIQFRGGRKGFLHVLDGKTIGFADLRGNTQYISVGNLHHDDRVALFLMDYPTQSRLKILGRGGAEAARFTAGPRREVARRTRSRHPRRSIRLELSAAHHSPLQPRRTGENS